MIMAILALLRCYRNSKTTTVAATKRDKMLLVPPLRARNSCVTDHESLLW
jgi:hypothetical protein